MLTYPNIRSTRADRSNHAQNESTQERLTTYQPREFSRKERPPSDTFTGLPFSSYQFEPRFSAPSLSLGVHDIKALFDPGDHLLDDLGRILEISIHDDRRVAFGIIQAGRHGNLMSAVSRQMQDCNARVSLRERIQLITCRVTAAVVDEKELEIPSL